MIALVSTYGIHLIASILYQDPWHMFTSLPAYVLGMTSSINILMVYAFCNWHDVSLGTKGGDKASSLPSALIRKEGDSKAPFIEEIDIPQADIDTNFEKIVKRALTPYVEPIEKQEILRDDSYRNFRTRLVLSWIFSNAIIAIGMTKENILDFGAMVCTFTYLSPSLSLSCSKEITLSNLPG